MSDSLQLTTNEIKSPQGRPDSDMFKCNWDVFDGLWPNIDDLLCYAMLKTYCVESIHAHHSQSFCSHKP
jgi:hypothetical protein